MKQFASSKITIIVVIHVLFALNRIRISPVVGFTALTVSHRVRLSSSSSSSIDSRTRTATTAKKNVLYVLQDPDQELHRNHKNNNNNNNKIHHRQYSERIMNKMPNKKTTMAPRSSSNTSLKVKACWSKAGIGTCFVLQQCQNEKFKMVFDLGCTPIFDETMNVNNVILSHVHLDHFGGIFSHARAHAMTCSGDTPNYYVPYQLVPKLQQAQELFAEIDSFTISDDSYNNSSGRPRTKKLLNMNIIPMQVGQEVEINQKKIQNGIRYYLRPFHVSHCGHPCLGYTVISKQTMKSLKEEYEGMEGKDMAKLVKSGVDITTTDVVEKVEACYTGDTNIDGLLLQDLSNKETTNTKTNANNDPITLSRQQLKEGFTAPLIICELTYLLESDRELAKERGHLNLYDIQYILKSHEWEEGDSRRNINKKANHKEDEDGGRKIIFYHLSSRGRTSDNILESFANVLPQHVLDISEIALASFRPNKLSHLLKDNGCISIADYMLDVMS